MGYVRALFGEKQAKNNTCATRLNVLSCANDEP